MRFVVLSIVAILVFPSLSLASIMYYSFEGTHDRSFVLGIDLESDGYSIQDGTTSYKQDKNTSRPGQKWEYTYFYAEAYTNDKILGKVTEQNNFGYNVKFEDVIKTEKNARIKATVFSGPSLESSDSSFDIFVKTNDADMLHMNSCFVEEWYVNMDKFDVYYISDTQELYSSAKIVGISSVNPFEPVATPIPGAVWLLGTGVLGLFGLRKKFQG